MKYFLGRNMKPKVPTKEWNMIEERLKRCRKSADHQPTGEATHSHSRRSPKRPSPRRRSVVARQRQPQPVASTQQQQAAATVRRTTLFLL